MKTKKTNSALFPLGLLAIGSVFFANPLAIGIIDIMPDVVAYILFATGLYKLSKINDHIKNAWKYFFILIFVSGAKLLCIPTLAGSSASYKLLIAFSFALVEAILFILATFSMYEGFDYMAARYGCPEIKLRTFTIIAHIARAVCSVVPLLPALGLSGVTYFLSDRTFDWMKFTPVLYILCWIAHLAVNIPWIVRFRRVIINGAEGINENTETKELYGNYIKELEAYPGVQIANRMKIVMLLVVAAAVFCVDVYIDYINVFPGIISAGILIGAFLLLKVECPKASKAGIILSSVWGVISLVSMYLQYDYRGENYKPASAFHMVGKAPEMYLKILIVAIIETLLMAATLLILRFAFTKAFRSHYENSKFGVLSKKKHTKKLITVIILWAVQTLSSLALVVFLTFFPVYWLINAILVLVLALVAYRTYTIVYGEVYDMLREK